MIRFERVPEPLEFNEKARDPGRIWLEKNPGANRPYDYWSRFKPHLADGFKDLCGYTAIYEPIGTVDHYISWNADPDLAYEWGNYRFCSQWVNSSKKNEDQRVLAPYEVGDDWFEIILPSLELVLTNNVPENQRERAQHTLNRLHLADDPRVIRPR